jgi:hypothetical protein
MKPRTASALVIVLAALAFSCSDDPRRDPTWRPDPNPRPMPGEPRYRWPDGRYHFEVRSDGMLLYLDPEESPSP